MSICKECEFSYDDGSEFVGILRCLKFPLPVIQDNIDGKMWGIDVRGNRVHISKAHEECREKNFNGDCPLYKKRKGLFDKLLCKFGFV